MKIDIRPADPSEHRILTEISFRSKNYWHYPDEYFETWHDELTIKKSYIIENTVFAAAAPGAITGFYSIEYNREDIKYGNVTVQKGFWLGHLFIDPPYIGRGIGRELFSHAVTQCRNLECSKLLIFSDPNCSGFYEKLGAFFIEDHPSSIEGRTVPVYAINIS